VAGSDQDLLTLLSPRQLEVLEHLADLKPNQEIADALYLSANTIKSHVSRIRVAFGLEDRAALVRKARALLKTE
jgi:LuxR family maltose regulon positive regulatory protein